MYSTIQLLAAAGLLVASTVHAQAPERALMSQIPPGLAFTSGARVQPSHSFATGEGALLGRVDHRPIGPARVTGAPIDGAQALLGKRPSPDSTVPGGRAVRSTFRADVRGHLTTSAAGEAEFGAVAAEDGDSSTFVVSLGVRGSQSAILLTRMGGAPLEVGRYRISDGGNGADEVLALVMTGSATNPTGVFRGGSGWLVVTSASDGLLTGWFHLNGVGFLAADPGTEDRSVNMSGSFSATAAAS